MVLPSFTSTAPSVHFTYPPASLFNFSPSSNPAALSPPVSDHSFARPFDINPELYGNALNAAVPITIAIIYGTAVTYVNRINKEREYKPWPFSKSLVFYFLVVAHNAFLAAYSAWTFLGMLKAIRGSWPGWDGQHGLAGVADALCKMNGPRGLGSAATYDARSTGWSYTDKAIKMIGGRPDSTDVGRIWNEGLAFYGWLFYISKFYEVVDTAIVLAKGKRSSDLQTFHHAGAMMCLWAGIRYMSPPIWMFVFINSGVHTVMYAYYFLSALTVQVPQYMKRVLTGLQIAQIIFGTSYALAHLFVAYDIPIEMPYLYVHNLSTALPSTASTVSSAVSSAFASATASAGLTHWLKKVALRAAGEEGLAENVRNSQGETFGIDAVRAADVEKAHEEIRYRMGTQRVHCLDTSGEVFAILLNAIYLVPLAVLFFRFFYKSYVSRAHSETPKPTKQENIKESSKTAEKKVQQEIKDAMANTQGGTTEPPPELKEKLENAKKTASDMGDKVTSQAKDLSAHAQSTANDLGNKAKDAAGDIPGKVQKGAQDLGNKAKDAAGDLPAKAQKGAQDLGNKAKDAAGDLPAKAQKGAQDLGNKAKEASGGIPAKAQEMGAQAKKVGKDAKQSVQDDLQALQEKMRKMGGEGQKPKSGKENGEPSSGSSNRDRSPEKASKPREKSPEKKALIHGENSSAKAPTPREKSPAKAPTPREKSPVKSSKPVEEPKNEPESKGPVPKTEPESKEEPESNKPEPKKDPEENKSSPDLGASGYEMVPDEPKTEEERKAEEEMRPSQS